MIFNPLSSINYMKLLVGSLERTLPLMADIDICIYAHFWCNPDMYPHQVTFSVGKPPGFQLQFSVCVAGRNGGGNISMPSWHHFQLSGWKWHHGELCILLISGISIIFIKKSYRIAALCCPFSNRSDVKMFVRLSFLRLCLWNALRNSEWQSKWTHIFISIHAASLICTYHITTETRNSGLDPMNEFHMF